MPEARGGYAEVTAGHVWAGAEMTDSRWVATQRMVYAALAGAAAVAAPLLLFWAAGSTADVW